MELNFYEPWFHRNDDEEVPNYVTHVIVDSDVTVIKKRAFDDCVYLVSLIMGDNVKIIEEYALRGCRSLRFLRLSRTLEFIREGALEGCISLEALFLPSTVKSIARYAFYECRSLRLLILPHSIDLRAVSQEIIDFTKITGIAKRNIDDDFDGFDDGDYGIIFERYRRVNEWLVHQMDEAPFHKLCYDSFVTTNQINEYLNENGNDSALTVDPYHGMTPLHMLTMNPYAPADAIAALLESNTEAAFLQDNRRNTPLGYAKVYNVDGFVSMMSILSIHRNSTASMVENKALENSDKRENFPE